MDDSVALVNKAFVVPTPQKALGGKEGITHVEIAQSLGIRPQDFKERFQDLKYDLLLQELGLKFEKIAVKLGARGRPTQVLVFPTEVARVLVANYPNNVGVGYALWLVKNAHRDDHWIYDRLKWLEDDNKILRENQKSKPLTPPKKRPRRLHVPFLVVGMYGITIELRKRAKNECEPWQWEIGLLPWSVHVVQKLQKRIESAIIDGERSIVERFLPTEMLADEGSVRGLLKRLITDMMTNTERYTESDKEEFLLEA